MNKNFSNLIFVFSLILSFVFIIAAQENITSNNTSYLIEENISLVEGNNLEYPNESNLFLELNNTENVNSSEIKLDEDIEVKIQEKLNNSSDNDSNESLGNIGTERDSEKGCSTKIGEKEDQLYIEYIEIIEENPKETNPSKDYLDENSELQTENITYTSLHVRGKKEIDVGEYNGMKITKDELEKSEIEKEVILSSEEHFEGYLRVYTSLTQESETKYIRVYWKNQENLEITNLEEFEVEYYDEDENGLVDRISWIVPHLSEQIFRVMIDLESSNESQENLLLNVSGPIGNTRNPILFSINVNYSKDFNCSLQVGGEFGEYFNSNIDYELELPNGNYNWGVVCLDPLNASITNTSLGSFSVNENFYSSLIEGKLYFLDLIQNKIQNPEIIFVNSSNPSNLSLQIIKNSNEIVYTKNYLNSASIPMNETILNSAGNYSLKATFSEISPNYVVLINFSVASANLLLNATSIKEGDSVKITANVNSPSEKINSALLSYGDGSSNTDYYALNSLQFNNVFTKKYTQKGNYAPKLSLIIGGESFEIQKNGLSVTEVPNPKDNDEPDITLLNPDPKEVIYVNSVNFSYKASDNVQLKNCTFKLYENCQSLTTCTTSESDLIFPTNSQQRGIANNGSVQNNKEVSVKLQDFEEGIYKWVVECYDNSSNYNWETDIFQISLNETANVTNSNYEYKEEVEELKELADNFLSLSFSLEEKEVLEGLNILNNTKYYKKRLLDVQEFFQENYKYVSNEALRERKTNEYLDELEIIKTGIPLDISIKEDYEYIKNSVDEDFQKIIEDYFYETNTQLSKSSLRKLEEINRQIQNEISVSVDIKHVEIEYSNGTQEIVFVKKKVTKESDSYNVILEIIPEEVVKNEGEIIFITDNEPVGSGRIFEIDYDDLINGEIIYYITKPIKLKDIENTETVLFEEYLTNVETRVTGFSVFGGFSEDLTIYIVITFILLIVLLVIIPIVIKKFKMISWKKEPNVVKVIHLIEEINRLLKEREIEKARENYYKIKEIYPVLPYKTRPYFYKKISEMLVKIDKKDIFGLVKEYQEAKKRWDKENLMRLYEDIKKIYKRLPEKDRKKVYDIINGY